VHISQLAWSRVNHPSEVLHVGQEVEVQVLSVDKDKKKIALSIKRAEVDPWTTVEQRYSPGQLVTGVVTKIAPFGAFARIEDGIEGLIHLSELTPGVDPKTILHEGAQLQLRILRIDAERRRLGLSLRQVDEPDAEKEAATPEVPAEAEVPVNNNEPAQPVPQPVPATPSLESISPTNEQPSQRRDRRDRQDRPGSEGSLLSSLASGEGEELTAMAEAFRAAARQRSKDETEPAE
jgi:small subunit ribosomal protein S1